MTLNFMKVKVDIRQWDLVLPIQRKQYTRSSNDLMAIASKWHGSGSTGRSPFKLAIVAHKSLSLLLVRNEKTDDDN